MTVVTRRYWLWTAFISVAIVALAGCAGGGKPAATSGTTTSSASWHRPATPPDPQTLLRAGAVAVAAVPSSTLIVIRTDQGGIWKVLVAAPDGTTQAMDVSSDGVTVLAGPTPTNQSDADKANDRARVQAAHLDYRAAVDKMLAIVPNGSITELNLGDSNGTIAWQADVWDLYIAEHKVVINAASGELVANTQV